MPRPAFAPSRRQFLAHASALGAALACRATGAADPNPEDEARERLAADKDKALVAITLDLEMSRNFPQWEMTHWDYEKGNLNEETKAYTVEACRRVKERGGVLHTFCVGRVLEQENVDWLKEIAAQGHPIGNHTYDHVYVLAKTADEIQFRFKRAPWLIAGKSVPEVIAENIHLTTVALEQRAGIKAHGFRTPGGFANGLDGASDIQQILLAQGFPWVSSKYPSHPVGEPGQAVTDEVFKGIVAAQAQAQPYVYPSGLVEVPMNPISDIGAFRGGRWKLDDFLHAIRLGVEWAIEHRAVFDLLAHPSCLYVTDPEFRTIDLVCDLVHQARTHAAITDLSTLAKRCQPS